MSDQCNDGSESLGAMFRDAESAFRKVDRQQKRRWWQRRPSAVPCGVGALITAKHPELFLDWCTPCPEDCAAIVRVHMAPGVFTDLPMCSAHTAEFPGLMRLMGNQDPTKNPWE